MAAIWTDAVELERRWLEVVSKPHLRPNALLPVIPNIRPRSAPVVIYPHSALQKKRHDLLSERTI
jgi:hypothetical protein